MALWGLIVAVLLVIGSLPLFLGLAVVLPVLGHATWHLYRRMVEPDATRSPSTGRGPSASATPRISRRCCSPGAGTTPPSGPPYRFSHSGTRLSASARADGWVPVWTRPDPSTEKA